MKNAQYILEQEIVSQRTPSVQYYLFNCNQVLKAVQLGMADIKQQKKVDDHTTYHAFSITKTFTALAVMQLVEQGLVTLDTPMVTYLPDFKYGDKITVRHLLSHSAGLPNPMPISWVHLAEYDSAFNEDAFFDHIFNKHNHTRFVPGQKFAYSNLGYVWLGRLIEKVSGEPYDSYIQYHILQHLAVGKSEIGFTMSHAHQHATGYIKRYSIMNMALGLFLNKKQVMGERTEVWRAFKSFYVHGKSYGGLIGTPNAFVKYAQELLKPQSVLIGKKYKEELFKECLNNQQRPTGMCLSWFTGVLNGVRYYTHAGGGGGYYCEIRLYPELQLGSVVFFNRTGVSDERFLDKLDREIVSLYQRSQVKHQKHL